MAQAGWGGRERGAGDIWSLHAEYGPFQTYVKSRSLQEKVRFLKTKFIALGDSEEVLFEYEPSVSATTRPTFGTYTTAKCICPLVKLCLKNFSGQEKLVTQLGRHHFLTTCLQFSCDLALLGGPLSITHKWVEHHMGTALVPNLSYTKALPKREKRKKKKATFLSFLSRGTIGNHRSTPIKGRDKVCVHYTYVTKRQHFYPFGAETP